MTSPIGKLLLQHTKLPLDVIQYCIEPCFMISEEQVRENHRILIHEFKSHSVMFYKRMLATMSLFMQKKEDRAVSYRKSHKKNSKLSALEGLN